MKNSRKLAKNARRKLEVSMPLAMPCITRREEHTETCSTLDNCETKYACIVQAGEPTRKRMEGILHTGHEDHTAGRGINSLNHYNLVHKIFPLLPAMKMPDANAAVVREWEKLEKMLALQLTTVRNKKEVNAEARNEGKTVHFASLMDLCHLKNSELEPPFQNCKGRVVLRGDIVKDDSGSYAVFT